MRGGLFSRIKKIGVSAIEILLFAGNLALLAGLGAKTVRLWINEPFDFGDIVAAFPTEPEFIDKVSAEKQFWFALSFETLVFVIGGFLCYELLIRQRTLRRGLIAPFVVVFLWAAGESVNLFMPATDKAQTIESCRAANITWDAKRHRCRLMDLELRRFEQLKAAKESAARRKKEKRKAALAAARAATVKTQIKETAAVPTPVPAKKKNTNAKKRRALPEKTVSTPPAKPTPPPTVSAEPRP